MPSIKMYYCAIYFGSHIRNRSNDIVWKIFNYKDELKKKKKKKKKPKNIISLTICLSLEIYKDLIINIMETRI